MTDLSPTEITAMQDAAANGGEYIESLCRTDMAAWSSEEWMTFIETVCSGYVDSLMRQRREVNAAADSVSTSPI